MAIKLVVLDLDDTLLDSQMKISQRSKEIIQEVRARGVQITFATGRMFPLALPFAEELGIDIPLITFQGALVKKSQSNEVLYARSVPKDLASGVIGKAKAYGYHYQIYLGDHVHMERLSTEGKAYSEKLKVTPVLNENLASELVEEPIKVFIIHDDPEKLLALEEHLKAEYGESLYITRSKPNYLEIMHSEANKLLALKALTESLGIKREEVMAVGDSYTDLELIRWAGVGVAMENSIDQIVKDEADYITLSNDEDGVALALEKFILNQG